MAKPGPKPKDPKYLEVSEWFKEYRGLKNRLKYLEKQAQRIIRSGPRGVSGMMLDDMPHGKKVINTEKQLNNLFDFQVEIQELTEFLKPLDDAIYHMGGKNEHIKGAILEGYYLDGRSLAAIAEDLQYSVERLKEIKHDAVEDLYIFIKGRTACKYALNGEEDK